MTEPVKPRRFVITVTVDDPAATPKDVRLSVHAQRFEADTPLDPEPVLVGDNDKCFAIPELREVIRTFLRGAIAAVTSEGEKP